MVLSYCIAWTTYLAASFSFTGEDKSASSVFSCPLPTIILLLENNKCVILYNWHTFPCYTPGIYQGETKIQDSTGDLQDSLIICKANVCNMIV